MKHIAKCLCRDTCIKLLLDTHIANIRGTFFFFLKNSTYFTEDSTGYHKKVCSLQLTPQDLLKTLLQLHLNLNYYYCFKQDMNN